MTTTTAATAAACVLFKNYFFEPKMTRGGAK